MEFSDIVRNHAERAPDQPAIITATTRLTYRELDRAIKVVAGRFARQGIGPGKIVGISLRTPLQHCVAMLALIRRGVLCVGVDWQMRLADRDDTCRLLKLDALLVDAATPAGSAPVLRFDATWFAPLADASDGSAGDAAVVPSDDDPALLVLTSGTTGRPKAMILSHAALVWRAQLWAMTYGAAFGVKTLCMLPLASAAGMANIVGQLAAGATIYLRPPMTTAAEVTELIRSEKIDFASVVPNVLRAMTELPGAVPRFPDIQALISTSARLQPEDRARAVVQLTPNLYDGYGAGSTGIVSVIRPRDIAADIAGVGRAAPFAQIDILDDEGRPLPTGAIGRVRVRSPACAVGYYGDTGSNERNEMIGKDGVYPGDLGRLDAAGNLFLEGRASSVIIRGGENIYPEEVERHLLAHPLVAEAAVLGQPDDSLGEVPVAIVVRRGEVTASDLVSHCHARLKPSKVPVRLYFVADLPRNAGGKVHRAILPTLLTETALAR